jgi:hypothetical protein
VLGAEALMAPARPGGPAVFDAVEYPVPSPFVVVGHVNGREETARVGTPAEALARMLEWLRYDDDAAAVWYLREDWPGSVTVIGRPAAGVVGETRRSAHLFSINPGTVQYGSVTAACGTELCLLDIEWLSLGVGMPCECCLALSTPVRPSLEGR